MKRETYNRLCSLARLAQSLVDVLDSLIEGDESDYSIPLCLCEDMIEKARKLMESQDE